MVGFALRPQCSVVVLAGLAVDPLAALVFATVVLLSLLLLLISQVASSAFTVCAFNT